MRCPGLERHRGAPGLALVGLKSRIIRARSGKPRCISHGAVRDEGNDGGNSKKERRG